MELDQEQTYDLYAVIKHRGLNINGGHFFAKVLDINN